MKIVIIVFTFFIFTCSIAQSNSGQLAGGNSAAKPKSFTYQLTTNSTTSAGIYSTDNVLIRTLWAQKVESAGRHSFTWDGLDDSGKPVSAARYTWKVLTNNVQYKWQGVIGNTSDSMSGTTKHKGYYPITTMCFAGSKAYYGTQYDEALTNTFVVDTADIGQRVQIGRVMYGGFTPAIIKNCTDGNYVYWAGQDAYFGSNSFVYATKVSDNTGVVFPSGTTRKITYGVLNYSFINDQISAGTITDITVQKTGNFLFTVRNNRITVLDKTKGAFIDSVIISHAKYARVDATDGYLWVTHDVDSTTRFVINADGTLTTTGLTIVTSQPVVSIDINPTNSMLAICEGGTAQIIKFYNPINGGYINLFGQAGGYLTNATVANDKFYWNDARGTYAAFVAFTPNGTFWAGDYGNNRVQHYDVNNNYLARIQWIPVFYNIGVDYGNTTRVFADMKEYQVDWTKPLDNGTNGSWTLVRNWGGDLKSTDYDANIGLHTPLTFSNGHTYCFFAHNGNANIQLIELNRDGTKRYTGKMYPNYYYLDKSYNIIADGMNGGLFWGYFPLTGFDGQGTPIWSTTFTRYITGPTVASGDAVPEYGVTYRPNAITDDSVFVQFSGDYDFHAGYHLAGLKGNKWVFKTAKANSRSYTGPFPTGEQFETGNSVRIGGGVVVALGKGCIWNYHGEFWKGTQSNMFTHVYSNGLVINQFGVANGYNPGIRASNCFPGDAGNAYSVNIVTVNGNTYLLHNDESIQGGIHVWKITGLNTIKLLTGNFSY